MFVGNYPQTSSLQLIYYAIVLSQAFKDIEKDYPQQLSNIQVLPLRGQSFSS